MLGPSLLRAQTQPVHMEVWKSPSCGCCKEWIKHVESRGFRVTVHDVGNTVIRARMKLPTNLGSCHTAVVGRYAVEGHVPAADVLRLIKEAPDAVGLAVPGMPVGSPGMDGPDYGDQVEYLRVFINQLRKKLEPGGVFITTLRGLGYCLQKPANTTGTDD